MSGLRHSTDGAFAAYAGSVGAVVGLGLLFEKGRVGSRLGVGAGTATAHPTRGGAAAVLQASAGFLALALVATAWEALGIDTGRREAHLTVSALAEVFRPFHAAVFLVWFLVGIGGATARARRPPGRAGGMPVERTAAPFAALGLLLPDSRAAGITFWLVWFGACVGYEVAARSSSGRFATAEELAASLSANLAGAAACAGLWAYAGWHLFAH